MKIASRRTRELVVAAKHATYANFFRTPPLGKEPKLQGYAKTGLHARRLPRYVIHSMVSRSLQRTPSQWLSGHKRTIETGRHYRPREQEKIGYALGVGSYRKRGRQLMTSIICYLIAKQQQALVNIGLQAITVRYLVQN
jgi:hypothetical protein